MKITPVLSLALLLACGKSHAAGSKNDGAYGRLGGDLAVAADVGVAAANGSATAMAALSARYLQTAGAYISYNDDFASQPSAGSRALVFGVDLRPFFIPRIAKDLERGPSQADLSIDSLGIRIGAVMSRIPGFSPSSPGVEICLVWGIPISGQATGLWLNLSGGVRVSSWSMTGARDMGNSLGYAPIAMFSASFAWQQLLLAHIAGGGARPEQ